MQSWGGQNLSCRPAFFCSSLTILSKASFRSALKLQIKVRREIQRKPPIAALWVPRAVRRDSATDSLPLQPVLFPVSLGACCILPHCAFSEGLDIWLLPLADPTLLAKAQAVCLLIAEGNLWCSFRGLRIADFHSSLLMKLLIWVPMVFLYRDTCPHSMIRNYNEDGDESSRTPTFFCKIFSLIVSTTIS